MQRIALILLLYVLLLNGPHLREMPPLPATPIAVRADALPLPDARALRDDYGLLRLTGLWQLRGSIRNFGGISSMLAATDGRLLGLSDSGEWMTFLPTGGKGDMNALPRLPDKRSEENWKQDSESMTRDNATGRIWVGFERVQRICRYNAGRIEACVSPPEVRRWPKEGSLESLVRFGDGRFLAIGERANRIGGGFDALLWSSDPVDPGTPPPVHLRYRGAPGYRPTDAIWLGGDRLLVLERRLTLIEGFSGRLTLVRLPKLRAGAELRGEVIARFQRPGPADNLEALALARDPSGRPILYIASDDNHLFLQRSLLFHFALPADWVSERPAP